MSSPARIGSPSSGDGIVSHGRGGAGNITKDRRPSATAADLATPTIKADTYTTGRGGSGNMAHKDPEHPELARISQDVEAPLHREPEGKYHVGRGGAANVARVSGEEARKNQERNRSKEKEARSASPKEGNGVMNKAKGVLEKIGLGHEGKK